MRPLLWGMVFPPTGKGKMAKQGAVTVTASFRRSHLQSPDWESPSGAGHFGPGPLFGAEGPCGEKRGKLWWVLPSRISRS